MVTHTQSSPRLAELRLGVRIEQLALAWMVVEAVIALAAGVAAGSASLEAFGLDSIIELVLGAVLLWRLQVERRGGDGTTVAAAERRASWVAGIGLLALALYVLIDAGASLLLHLRPQPTLPGLFLALASSLIMPAFWLGKRRVADRISSAALRADAACSATCAYMSITLLVGLALNLLLGWWWADPLAALALVWFIVREGRESIHAARTGERCDCCG